MKVVFLSFSFGEYSVRLASALANHASVLLLLPERIADPFLAELDHRVEYRTFPEVRLRHPLAQLRRNQWLMRQIRDFSADILHIQQGSLWFNLRLRLGRRLPVVMTVHDAEPHDGDKLSLKTPYIFWKLGFRRANHVITHNYYVRDLLQSRMHLAEKKLHVIPHVQIGQGRGAAIPSHDDGRTVLFFGRIWPYKGLEYLIRSEPWITTQVPDAKIVIAGVGEDFEHYRRMMINPRNFVVLNRQIPEGEASRLFQHASLVVLPYIEASQSGVVPVAYTYSKPVIATWVGGLPEMVEDGVTGLLVPPRNEFRLAAAIVTLLNDDDMRRRMGSAGKQRIERECAPSVVARQTVDVYRHVLPMHECLHMETQEVA